MTTLVLNEQNAPNLTSEQRDHINSLGIDRFVYRAQPEQYPIAPRPVSWSGFASQSSQSHLLPEPDSDGNRYLLYIGDITTAGAYATDAHNDELPDGNGNYVTVDEADSEICERWGKDTSNLDRLYRIDMLDIVKGMGTHNIIIPDEGQKGNSWIVVGNIDSTIPKSHIKASIEGDVRVFTDSATGIQSENLRDFHQKIIELPQALDTRNAEINEGQMRGVELSSGVHNYVSPNFSHPGLNASIKDHIKYMIDARNYVANYPVPENASYRQYSHNPDAQIVGGDPKRPAITDCSYEHFDRQLISVGFPLHVPSDDELVNENGEIRPIEELGFSKIAYQFSFNKVMEHFLGPDSLYGQKIGYQRETHHYIEAKLTNVTDAQYGRAIIERIVNSTSSDPTILLNEIDTNLNSFGGYNKPSITKPALDIPDTSETKPLQNVEHSLRGVGAALGVYGVVRQFQSGEFQNSIKAGGQEAALASGNLAANIGAAASDILETAHFTASKGSLGSRALSLSSQFNGAAKFVGRTAVPLALAAGALETGVAIQQRNPEKAAGAIGSTLGGLAAGAGAGALLGTMGAGPVGTIVGGVVGGVAGAIVGEKVVKATMTNTIAGMMGTAPPDGKETIGYRAGRTINHVGQTISHGIEKAIGSPVGRAAIASTALAFSPGVTVAGTITNGIQELSRRHDIASDRRSVDRLSFDQLRNEIKNDRILPDRVNHNGRVMNIEDACRDPAYVTRTLGNLERIHMSGKQDVSRQVAIFQELQERQKNSQAMAPHNIQRNSTASNQALEEREIAIDRRQYDRMSLDQLRAEAKRDGTLPDRVTHNGRTMGIDEACRDPSYVQKTLRNLENLNNSGRADVSQEVALFREINERLNGQQAQTNIPTIARTANLSMG